jgi:hypothetical protein
MLVLNGGIGARYSFDTYEAAIKRLHSWFNDGLITEKECMAFIIQMFNQIPEGIYNDIINED